MNYFDSLWPHLTATLFRLGDTPISLARLAGFVLIVSGAWWLSVTFERSIRRVAAKRPNSAAGIYAWARVTRYTIWVVATLIGVDYIGIDLTNFALIGGAVGVGIGFGLQNIFSNFFSGIILLLEKTLKEGDFVDLQSGTRGHVREIGLRYTRVTTNDEVDVIVPNSEFINGRVVNWTFGSHYRRMHIPFGVAYGTDKAATRTAVLKAARGVTSKRVIAVMQPHRYTRLRDLFDDFCSCFNDADAVVLAPVYEAGEQPIEGASHTALAEGLRSRGHRHVHTISHHTEIAPLIHDIAASGDVVICLGAGNITQWAYALPDELKALGARRAGA